MDVNPLDETIAHTNARVVTALGETMAPFEDLDLVGAPAQPDESESSDSRYVELGQLGVGGLGEVVEAWDQDLRRVVALKRPLPERMSGTVVAALIEEAQITAQLDHPNIPAVHAIGVGSDGRPWFAMTRLRGRSLRDLLEARANGEDVNLDTSRILNIVLQVGWALAQAHEMGVIHRDLKPDNVMLGEFGEVRVMDWGIARVAHRAAPRHGENIAREDAEKRQVEVTSYRGKTRVGAFLGTLGYAPREQVLGEEIDGRCDIYALGVVAYELFSGRIPCKGQVATELISSTLDGKQVPLKKHRPHLSPRLHAVIHKAIDPDPDERYQSMTDFLNDIERLLKGASVSALDENAIEKVGRWYLGRSPRLSRLRGIDIEAMYTSATMVAFAAGALLAPSGWWLWAMLAVGIIIGVMPVYTLLRADRPEDHDPTYLFGVTTTRSSGRE